jgi:peptidoglycan hydrolase-like protein with peptidoglycan-binding domain
MNSTMIRNVQKALRASGHYNGPVDGIFGSATRSAIRSYQKAKGLPVAGLSVATMQSLGLY